MRLGDCFADLGGGLIINLTDLTCVSVATGAAVLAGFHSVASIRGGPCLGLTVDQVRMLEGRIDSLRSAEWES